MLTENRDGLDVLKDYVIQTASRQPDLTSYQPRPASARELLDGEVLIVEDEAQARMSVLVAEALMQMSRDLHPADEWADDKGAVTGPRALVLVKEHGGIRAAARATGVSRNKLWRALREYKEQAV